MNPMQPARAEYVFAQLNQLSVPYSWPSHELLVHTPMVNMTGATTNRAMPPHVLVRPSSENAIKANRTNSQIAQTDISVAW